MSDLQELLDMQKATNEYIITKRGIASPSLLDFCRALQHELVEIEDKAGWKWWKTNKQANISDLQEEAIDALHFWLCIALSLGMNAEDIMKAYKAKNQINHDRQKQGY